MAVVGRAKMVALVAAMVVARAIAMVVLVDVTDRLVHICNNEWQKTNSIYCHPRLSTTMQLLLFGWQK